MHLFHFALQYILVYFHKMRYYKYIRNYFSYRRSILVGCFPLWDHMRNGSSFNIYETRLLPGFSLLFLSDNVTCPRQFLMDFATQNAHSAIMWQSGHFSYLGSQTGILGNSITESFTQAFLPTIPFCLQQTFLFLQQYCGGSYILSQTYS